MDAHLQMTRNALLVATNSVAPSTQTKVTGLMLFF